MTSGILRKTGESVKTWPEMTWFNKLHCYIFRLPLLLDDTIANLVKVEPSRGKQKKTSTSQLDIGIIPFDYVITNFQNIRQKNMPTTNLMRKKARWSRIPDPGFPENNSYQTKNLRWKALGLAIDNMKIPYLDHQCRNQLRPCQSEVHGTWAKVVKQTTQRVFSKRAGLPCSLLTYPSTYRISTSTLLLKSCSYMCKSQRLKSQEVAGWALKWRFWRFWIAPKTQVF